MDGFSRKDQVSPQLLDLIPKERNWSSEHEEEEEEEETKHGLVSEERKVELSLGLAPPGGEWNKNNTTTIFSRENSSILSFGNYFSNQDPVNGSPWQQHQTSPYFHHLHSKTYPVIKDSSQPCSNRDIAENNTAVTNNSSSTTAQKRTAPAPVVGWPPIRSFRKNLANGTCSKPASSDSLNVAPNKTSGQKPTDTTSKGLFVKINMDGIPIGRKIDLKAYDSYEKLSVAVDELFRGLLAAQNDSSDKIVEGKRIGGLLDGSGEYTLVYEDN